MSLPTLPDLSSPLDELEAVRQRLLAVKASLQQACLELDDQIQALEGLTASVQAPAVSPKGSLFESEPVPPLQSPQAPTPALLEAPVAPPLKNVVMEAKGPACLDPDLEQATLEELNSALSKAFAQIASRHPWAG